MLKSLAKMFLWYLLSLGLLTSLALLLPGRRTLIKQSAKVKPYAVVLESAERINALRSKPAKLVVFFGDSSVAQPPWAQKNSPHIPALLEDDLRRSYPGLDGVSVVDWSFVGARMFHYYCLLFEAERCSADLVIIPINWRNLGPLAWEHKEMFCFPELSMLVPFGELSRPSAKKAFGEEDLSLRARLSYMRWRPALYLIGLKTWGRTRLGMEPEEDPLAALKPPPAEALMAGYSDTMLFNQYDLELGAANPQLAAVRLLAETSDRLGLKVLFYITPIHIDEMRGRQSFDPHAFGSSVTRIGESATFGASTCVDLAELLREKHFIDCMEHYTPEGNRKIGSALAPAAARLLQAPDRSIAQASPTGADGAF